MNKDRELITPIQLAVIVTSTIIGVSLLALPKFVVEGAGVGAPFASIVGVMISFLGLLGIVLLGKRFPKDTMIGYNERILGKPLGRIFSGLMILFFIILMGLETRHFAEVIAGALLPNTPIAVSLFFMIFLCAVSGFQQISSFAYIHFFYLPLILIPLLAVILPSFKDIEIYHITPILGYDPTFLEFMLGGLAVTQAITNFAVIAFLIPFMAEPKKCVKSGIWGFMIGSSVVVILITINLAVFGEKEIQQMIWPTLILGKMVQVPMDILSRIDSFLLIAWIFAVFTTLLSYYFVFVRGTAELFQTKKYNVISVVGFPLAFAIALLPQNVHDMYRYLIWSTSSGLLLTVVYPIILLFISLFRKRMEDSYE